MDGYDFVWNSMNLYGCMDCYGFVWICMDISLFHFYGLVRNSS